MSSLYQPINKPLPDLAGCVYRCDNSLVASFNSDIFMGPPVFFFMEGSLICRSSYRPVRFFMNPETPPRGRFAGSMNSANRRRFAMARAPIALDAAGVPFASASAGRARK